MELQGKVALVTGGAVRVGRAISVALARSGADVVINYHRSEEGAEETAREIERLGRKAFPFRADVSQAPAIETMMEEALARFGRLDVLVNSASYWRKTPWPELTEADWDHMIGIDLKGPFLCSKAAAPHLAAHADGAIVNIVDLSAFVPFTGYLPHSVAKAGLVNMTYALAIELAPHVRVNAVAPGPVLPPPGTSLKLMEAQAENTVLGRWGSPNDVAEAVVYLVRAPYVTGAVLPVDGGQRLGRARAT